MMEWEWKRVDVVVRVEADGRESRPERCLEGFDQVVGDHGDQRFDFELDRGQVREVNEDIVAQAMAIDDS